MLVGHIPFKNLATWYMGLHVYSCSSFSNISQGLFGPLPSLPARDFYPRGLSIGLSFKNAWLKLHVADGKTEVQGGRVTFWDSSRTPTTSPHSWCLLLQPVTLTMTYAILVLSFTFKAGPRKNPILRCTRLPVGFAF